MRAEASRKVKGKRRKVEEFPQTEQQFVVFNFNFIFVAGVATNAVAVRELEEHLQSGRQQ